MKPETRLDIAKRLVVEAEALVARQQDLAIYLACNRHNTDQAIKLLESLEVALKNFRCALTIMQSSRLQ